jgi:DNA ligase-1
MATLADGEQVEVEGSAARPYVLKNSGGVYSCTCQSWRFQNTPIERRSCKHLRAYLGDTEETARVGNASREPRPARTSATSTTASTGEGRASPDSPPKLLLAHKWDGQDPANWWMSEKLDGVRAYWDGTQFLSRQGNVFLAPPWFLESLPADHLDGELWVGRGMFQRTVSVVRRMDQSAEWRQVRYLVFDAPQVPGGFEDRFDYAKQLIATISVDHVQLVAHDPCRDHDHLRDELRRVEALGGEGLMLRKAGSTYQHGRSTTCLKVKSFHDAEGRVIAHFEGTGRHMNRLGALRVEVPDGTTFSVGTGFSDAERESPPAIGSLITFRFQELTNAGVPRFPSFVSERHDISWDQVQWPPTEPQSPADDVVTMPFEDLTGVAGLEPPAEVSRQLQYEAGKSVKFWEIEQDGKNLTITYGRVGREPRVKHETFASARQASQRANDLADAKLEKGYEEF